jgi:metal-responsive CopG/Arc/MetJ family transcriptional regulator
MKYGPIPFTAKRVAEVQRLLYTTEKKAKASVSISGELLRATDAIAGEAQRSAFVERALRHYVKALLRRAQREQDLVAINAHAAATNRESDQLLGIQPWPK